VTIQATPPTPEDAIVPIMDAQLGRDSTDALACCHLAASLASTPTINSTGRLGPRPPVRSAPTLLTRHDHAAQRAQSVQRVPSSTRPF
jgi:hypothetical protein